MNKLIEFNVPGGTVVVESRDAAAGNVVRGAALDHITEKVGKSLEETLSIIHPVAQAALSACSGVTPVPAAVEVEFGIKFSIGLGAFIANSGAEGTMRVKLVLKPEA